MSTEYTIEEQRANRELWYQALESGEYSQTRYTLQDRVGHCCLGVACDVYEKSTGSTLPKSRLSRLYLINNLSGDYGKVKDWLGLFDCDGSPDYCIGSEVPDDDMLIGLVELNDCKLLSFEQIANHMEKFEKYYIRKEFQ